MLTHGFMSRHIKTNVAVNSAHFIYINNKTIINKRYVRGKVCEFCLLLDFSFVFAPGVSREPKKRLWICGHSIVKWRRCRQRTDQEENTWMGKGGMNYDQFTPTLIDTRRSTARPDFLVIHLGENDLVHSSSVDLIKKT